MKSRYFCDTLKNSGKTGAKLKIPVVSGLDYLMV